jgi:hypothetical protein
MTFHLQSNLLFFYGAFLIVSGIVAVASIGLKAKTALASGGMSGLIALVLGYFVARGYAWATYGSFALPFILLIVFSWRSTKTLHKIIELIPNQHPDLNGKGIAFLIISLMAVVSLITLMLLIMIS